jgi:hypothetical protein
VKDAKAAATGQINPGIGVREVFANPDIHLAHATPDRGIQGQLVQLPLPLFDFRSRRCQLLLFQCECQSGSNQFGFDDLRNVG